MKKLLIAALAALSVSMPSMATRIDLKITDPIEQELIFNVDYEGFLFNGSTIPASVGSV